MGRWFNRLLNLLGFERVEEPVPEGEDGWEGEENPRSRRGSLVSLPGSHQIKVMLVEPNAFEEVQRVADHLKNRRPVILNLERAEKEMGQRVLNFLSGTIYALNGNMHRVGNGIFFFAPSNVELVSTSRDEWREARTLPWGRARAGDGESEV